MSSQPNKRRNPFLRQRIDKMIAEGFSLSGREPVRLERGPQVYEVRGGGLVRAA